MLLHLIAVLIVLVGPYFSIFLVRHVKALNGIKFYAKQGIMICPKADRFIVGNQPDFIKIFGERNASPTPMKGILGVYLDKLPGCESKGFTANEYPVLVMNIFGRIEVTVSDPDMVYDLFGAKNGKTDKSGDIDRMFKELLGESFLFSKGDKVWKQKR